MGVFVFGNQPFFLPFIQPINGHEYSAITMLVSHLVLHRGMYLFFDFRSACPIFLF